MITKSPFGPGHDPVVNCTCNMTYTSNDREDVCDHARHHAEFERVTRLTGHVPLSYTKLEKLKDDARDLLREEPSDADVVMAAEMILRAYFDRSFQRAIECLVGDLHPSLPEFGKALALGQTLSPNLSRALLRAYGSALPPCGTIVDRRWEHPLMHGLVQPGVTKN